ncbi:HypC/HybG/HupF family hydrogenase formation chaperone [Candidatus Woesearchaeota archaeon CG08_land_8_20_14_0_20_47_9]|nr:MAG: HypC/HybG/HupF family hydrogenase formation chaperone [Candidatus Woesearchaeota archaeon CG10_big_fil_rev_8_21_14_0_10_47_5]PIO03090.1 MAG: HypC/HybG/HupF family hydrogenase formation chaperone [Candidatus Woesearchaeota archaeon CG08_land_8_20_14_0_20_47_9]
MCLAIPGRIISISNKEAKADFGGVLRSVRLDFIDAKQGDFVLVHAGFAIAKLEEEEALSSLKTVKEAEERGQR